MNKASFFLVDEYDNTKYRMEHGIKYLEKQYGLVSRYNDSTLSQQQVQLLRLSKIKSAPCINTQILCI